jgi:hypothetical protein
MPSKERFIKTAKTRTSRLTDEQQRIIRERFATTRTDELAALLGLGYFKVLRVAHRMGLAKASDFSEAMSAIAVSKKQHYRCKGDTKFKPGSIEAEERDKWMREHWAVTPDEQCAMHFGVNPRTIRRWANRLGLRKDVETSWMRRQIGRVPSPEDMFVIGAYIAEHYPTEPAKEIAKVLGIGATSVWSYAKRLGIKKSENMEQKRHGGSPVRPVAQLDPETLEVIKVWESIGDAKKAVGSTNIETAIKKLRKSKGFYWCDSDKVEDFKLSLQQKPKRQKRQAQTLVDFGPVGERTIADYTDEELWHELERRGWEGNLTRRQVVTLGTNK